MKKFRLIIISKKMLMLVCLLVLCFLALFLYGIHLGNRTENVFIDPQNGVIVIDPGHGGVDGGTNKDGILEKDANLDISLRLRTLLETKGYQVVMTREEDVALDNLDKSSSNRHQRDLNARVRIINNSNAQLFLSVHVNCNFTKTTTDGAIVFYNNKFSSNKELAVCIQAAMNQMTVKDKKRTPHEPQTGEYFLLKYSKVPGVIVETAFMSNDTERRLITTEGFKEQIALAIAEGMEDYLEKSMLTNK